MDTIDFLMHRRSIRKYKKDLVPWDNIVSVINCALNAPIAGNIFNVKFIVIRDPDGITEIAKACHDQMWMTTAPVLIAIVGEPEHQQRYYGARGEKLYTMQNCAACAMSIISAAESLGLGSCWVGSFDEDKLVSCLGLPEEVNVHAIISLGFADEEPHAPPKQWFKAAVYLEKWWAGRKVPGYGYYSENVMKVTKDAGNAIKKLSKHILGKKEETEGMHHREKRVDEER